MSCSAWCAHQHTNQRARWVRHSTVFLKIAAAPLDEMCRWFLICITRSVGKSKCFAEDAALFVWSLPTVIIWVSGGSISQYQSCYYRPQTKLQKGNVFTPVSHSSCSRGRLYQHALGRDHHQSPNPPTPTPQQPLQRTERILLECKLVFWTVNSCEVWRHLNHLFTSFSINKNYNNLTSFSWMNFTEFSGKIFVITLKVLELATQPPLVQETKMLPQCKQETWDTGSLNWGQFIL